MGEEKETFFFAGEWKRKRAESSEAEVEKTQTCCSSNLVKRRQEEEEEEEEMLSSFNVTSLKYFRAEKSESIHGQICSLLS